MGNLASALHWSVRRLDDVDNVLRAFFDAGASPNLENSDGCTLLEYALFVGASHASTVTLLLERGADVLRMTRFGTPFLVKAAATQPEAVINAMLKAGAPVNATELAPTVATGATALHVAASYARPEIVEMLLAAGADPCARTSEGTPLGLLLACMASAPESFAAERRRRCVELLEKAIAAA
jgi:ankyrin repeat protein